MNIVFSILLCGSIVYCLVSGGGEAVLASLLAGADDAVSACIKLCGAYLVWMGLLNVMREAELVDALSRLLRPVLKLLFRDCEAAHEAVSLNLSANMLGMGNAATPYGIEAMRRMQQSNPRPAIATNGMCVLIAINASCLELFPASLVALRQSCGSLRPTAVVLPTILSSLAATAVAVVLCLLCIRPCRSQSSCCC